MTDLSGKLPDFSGVDLIVVGDVCEDVILAGPTRRFARETPGLPVVDIELSIPMQGGAAVLFRQAKALGAGAWLIPTGPPAVKTRLYATDDGVSRQVARWDQPWPPEDGAAIVDLFRAARGNVLIYSQVRPEAPTASTVRLCRGFKGFKVADARRPAYFAGFDALKISSGDAWDSLQEPRPRLTTDRVMEVAEMFTELYGYRLVVITMGKAGYGAAVDGARIRETGIPDARRVSGAGDIFAATLACALAANMEARDALQLANRAAGLACRKEEHLATVSIAELTEMGEKAT